MEYGTQDPAGEEIHIQTTGPLRSKAKSLCIEHQEPKDVENSNMECVKPLFSRKIIECDP